MIISASRRTDIPTLYSDWFFNRIKLGFVQVRNPMNYHQVSQVSLNPDVVDGIVFWTKNPLPMLSRLKELGEYTYYYQFTLNPYDVDVEPNVPNKGKIVIPTFQRLSDLIGPERIVWRYDPIIINCKYSVDYHFDYFNKLANLLSPYARKCTFSYLDSYKSTLRNTKNLGLFELTDEMMLKIAQGLYEIAASYHLDLDTCAEKIDLDSFGIPHAHCIDQKILEELSGDRLILDRDKNQREECGCIASIDIGTYNTCINGCRYCYANYNASLAERNNRSHKKDSPLLFGELASDDVVAKREVFSCKDCQFRLFSDEP